MLGFPEENVYKSIAMSNFPKENLHKNIAMSYFPEENPYKSNYCNVKLFLPKTDIKVL